MLFAVGGKLYKNMCGRVVCVTVVAIAIATVFVVIALAFDKYVNNRIINIFTFMLLLFWCHAYVCECLCLCK